MSLPHVSLGTSWGDMPTYLVSDPATKAKPRGFCLYRAPHDSAVDPRTGEPYDDLLVISVAHEGAKQELVDGDGPFFTVPHLDRSNAVLVQQSRLGEVTLGELMTVLDDAWSAVAPPKLVREHREHRAQLTWTAERPDDQEPTDG